MYFAVLRIFVTLVTLALTILFRQGFSRFDDDEYC